MLEALRGWWLDRKDARLVAERVARFAAAEVLFVSFTKSGRTWLRVLLSNVYARRFDLSDRELLNGDNLHRLDSRVPRVHFAPDTCLPYPELGPPQVRASAAQKVVFLVRDPRDIAVSLYHHVLHRAGERELRRKKIPLAARDTDLDSFVLDESHGAPRVIRYLNRWVTDAAALPASLRIRYEDLRADTRGELDRLVRFVDLDATPEMVEEAVAFAAFRNMQEKEREGYFNSDRLGRADPDDVATGKVRAGRVGGYRESLRPATVEALDRMIEARLDPTYGYR